MRASSAYPSRNPQFSRRWEDSPPRKRNAPGANPRATPCVAPGGVMSAPDGKVLVASLWRRTSGKGNEHLSGFLGKARIIGFHGEPTADGTPTWDIYVTPGKEQEERGSGQRESRSPTSLSRTGVQRWAIRKACTF